MRESDAAAGVLRPYIKRVVRDPYIVTYCSLQTNLNIFPATGILNKPSF